MMGDNLLSGIGLFVCIGGILMVALVAFLGRKAFGSRTNQQQGRNDPSIWTERGKETPREDSRDIGSSGGFGNAPTRSQDRPSSGRQGGTTQGGRQSGFGGQSGTTGRSGGSGGLGRTTRQDRPQQQDDDDDDVRSSGGFGG